MLTEKLEMERVLRKELESRAMMLECDIATRKSKQEAVEAMQQVLIYSCSYIFIKKLEYIYVYIQIMYYIVY